MAFVNFSELPGGIYGATDLYGEAPVAHRSGFTTLEWQVIALSQRDTLSTLGAPSRLTAALEAVFGFRRPNPELANSALETLRRISVLAWHRGYALPQSQIDAFHAAGFSEDQLETLLASIATARAGTGRKAFA